MPSIVPDADDDGVLQAGGSRSPALRRALYGLVSVNVSGSVETQVRVVLDPGSSSNSIRSRSVALSRKWCAHFGQTFRFVARSLL